MTVSKLKPNPTMNEPLDFFEVINPSTGKRVGQAPVMTKSQVITSIDDAEIAFQLWRNVTAADRCKYLMRWADLMLENKEKLAQTLTSEQGKPINEARGEVEYAASFLEWFAQEGRRAYGKTIPSHTSDMRLMTIQQPIGIVAAITPWNFPLAMITRKAGAALAAGCTCVVKPAELTPLSAFALIDLAREAGIPEHVIQVVTGDPVEIGAVFTSDERIRKISFTGSTRVGRLLYAQSANSIKKLSLELGGNAPFIVFDDAHIGRAVEAAIACKFRNAGQTCVSANRFYVQNSMKSRFCATLASAMESLTIGDGAAEETQIGPVINSEAFLRIKRCVEEAVANGAKVIFGGNPHPNGGNFFEPTIITNVPKESTLLTDEIFGPVVSIIEFEDEDDLFNLVNNSEYGLASYVFTENLDRALRTAEAIEAGMVAINTGKISTAVAPFGGVKQSGLGREGGPHGIEEFMETKLIAIGLKPL